MATLADIDGSAELRHALDVVGRELAETSLPSSLEGGDICSSGKTATARVTWAGELPAIAPSLRPGSLAPGVCSRL